MSHCVADGSPGDGSTANPASGLQNAEEVSTLPSVNPALESGLPPEPNQSSRSKKEPSHNSAGAGKHHHSNHRHRSPYKRTSAGHHRGRKSTGKDGTKKDDRKGDSHQHHSSGHHRSRHHSPDKKHSRSHSAENTLDGQRRGHRHGRSPDRHRGHHSSHQRHHSPRRHRSPHRSRHHSPTRRHAHSSDPYRNASPVRYSRGNDKPNRVEAAFKEPSKTPEFSLPLEDSILREPPALDRLNREATLEPLRREERLFGEDSLLMRASSMDSAYRGDSLLRDVASRGQRDAFRDTTLPRVRTPDSDSAYKKYSSLLRGRSAERTERNGRLASRGSTPEPLFRARSLGRDISPIRSFTRVDSEDEEDDDNFVSAKVREYYSNLKTNRRQSPKPTLPEPKKTYKENPKDLSIWYNSQLHPTNTHTHIMLHIGLLTGQWFRNYFEILFFLLLMVCFIFLFLLFFGWAFCIHSNSDFSRKCKTIKNNDVPNSSINEQHLVFDLIRGRRFVPHCRMMTWKYRAPGPV